MFNKNDIVKINFQNCDKQLSKEVKQDIYNFDNKYNSIHKVTNIYNKNLYTKENVLMRIELDGEYVFYENELILINKGDK